MFGKKQTTDTTPEQKRNAALSRYEDPISGFSSRDLRLGTWYVRHKATLRKIALTVFVLVDVLLLGYGLWGWGRYAFVEYLQDRAALSQHAGTVQNYAALQGSYRAQGLQFGTPAVFQSEADRYDMVIDVENPNDRWVAKITYQFTFAGGSTEPYTHTIMPGATHPLAVFGVAASGRPSGIRFQPLAIEWMRIDPHAVFDVEAYLAERDQFVVEKVTYTRATDGIGGDSVQFSLTNTSVFRYWSPRMYVELLDGTSRVGMVLLTVDQFEAGETEQVDLRLFGQDIFVTDVRVYPVFNFFDQGEYMD